MKNKLEQRIYRVIGIRNHRRWTERKVWRYFSERDALGRAQALQADGNLEEFSYADVAWKPVPSDWLENA